MRWSSEPNRSDGYADPPELLDAAISFAPAGSVVVDALRALAPGATMVINAVHLDRIPAFDYDLLWDGRLGAPAAVLTIGETKS